MAVAAPSAASATRLPRRVVWLFAGALSLVVAQLAWWTIFHVRFSLEQSRWQARQWSEERAAAAALILARLEAGDDDGHPTPIEIPAAAAASPAALLARHFPRLAWAATFAPLPADASAEERRLRARLPGFVITVAPAARQSLRARDAAHLRMFALEGGFFLGLLGIAAVMLRRILRHEVALLGQQANFLSAVTHELKSPLAAIRLFCETLAVRRLTPERRAHYLRTMLLEVDRLDGMVGNLLAVARLDAGGVIVRCERVDLGAAVGELVASLPAAAGGDATGFAYRPPSAPVFVDGDAGAVACIVRNLLGNAAKYGSHPARPVEVAVAAQAREASVVVTDFGLGLAARELPRIFAKFYRVGDEMVRDSEGSGLGLYLARALAEAQGGRLEAHSAGPGTGSTFVLFLPLAPSAREAA